MYCSSREDALASHNEAVVLKQQGFKVDDHPGSLKKWMKAGFPVGGTDAKSPEPLFEVTALPVLQPCPLAESIETLRLS
jgi:hypothetical protein